MSQVPSMWGDRLTRTIQTGLALIKQHRESLGLGDKIWSDAEIDAYLDVGPAEIANAVDGIIQARDYAKTTTTGLYDVQVGDVAND